MSLPRDILDILSKWWNGVLALVDNNKPYCIPMAYVIHNNEIYFLFVKEGRKTKCIEKNRNACYLVKFEDDKNIYSILIEGELERENNPEVIRQVVIKFYSEVFPKDPYFKEFKTVEQVEKLIKTCIEHPKIGVYKLKVREIGKMIKDKSP